MNQKSEKIYVPELASNYPGDPLPSRDPLKSLANWEAPPAQPENSGEEDPSPGPAPWAQRDPDVLLRMAIGSIVLGLVLLCATGVLVYVAILG